MPRMNPCLEWATRSGAMVHTDHREVRIEGQLHLQEAWLNAPSQVASSLWTADHLPT